MNKFIKVSGIIITVLVSLIYILSALAPYISPLDLSIITIFSLGYLPILLVFGTVIGVWFFMCRKIALLLTFVLLLGYKALFSTLAVNITLSPWQDKKDSTSIRILSWNVNRLGSPYGSADTPKSVRQQMLKFIFAADADIICFQDFVLSETKDSSISFVNNIKTIREKGKLISVHFPFYYEYNGGNYSDKIGTVIFSKYPIIDSGFIEFPSSERSGYVDLLVQSKQLRIYSAHLTSMSLWPNTENEAGVAYLRGDSTQIKAKTIAGKLLMFGKSHAAEAKILKTHMNKSPFPILFSGDLNSVPSSYIYRHLSSGLNDAFIESDFGIGGTYNRIFPKIRIDVLLHSKQLEVVQFTRPVYSLSDHYPMIADFKWKE
jgi:endonuclease/exonuclease/phosphatase family metal-dependent hydrolase